MESLDQTSVSGSNTDKEELPKPEDHSQETTDEVDSQPVKKGMSGFVKIILFTTVVLLLTMMGGVGYVYYVSNSGPKLSSYEPAPETPAQSAVRDQAQLNVVQKPTEQAAPNKLPPLFKSPTTAQESNSQSAAIELPTIKKPELEKPEPLTEMERLAQVQADEAEFNGSDSFAHEEHGHFSLGEDDLHESVLAEVQLLRDQQKEHEERFKSFDLAATALHRAHKDQIDAIAQSQNQTDQTLVIIKGQLISMKKQLEKGVSNPDLEASLKAVTETKKQVDKLVAQASQNNRNILWMSRERMCFLESKMGITKYSKQCASFLKKSKIQTPLAINSVAPPRIPSPRPVAGTANVPATVGAVSNPAPVANTTMLATNRPSNPCEFADRTWKLQLISGNNALMVRRTDGYESVVEEHTPVPGLGRAQLFNATGYPQYVQFTNGIVCGG